MCLGLSYHLFVVLYSLSPVHHSLRLTLFSLIISPSIKQSRYSLARSLAFPSICSFLFPSLSFAFRSVLSFCSRYHFAAVALQQLVIFVGACVTDPGPVTVGFCCRSFFSLRSLLLSSPSATSECELSRFCSLIWVSANSFLLLKLFFPSLTRHHERSPLSVDSAVYTCLYRYCLRQSSDVY